MSGYNPRSLIDGDDLGRPYELIDDSITFLITESKKNGYDAQVNATLLNDSTTRFAVSQVTQHTDIQSLKFDLILSKGKKRVSFSTSGTDKQALQKLINTGIQTCEKSPEIPFYQGLPSPKSGTVEDLSGKPWSVEDRADAIIATVNSAENVDKNVRTAGTAQETKTYVRIVSTEGIDVEDAHQRNYFKVNAICGDPDQRGYGQEEIHWRFQRPNYDEFGRQATQVAVDTIKLIDLPVPKDYEVLLSPQSFTDILGMVLFSLDAPSFHESRSFSTDKIGAQVFDSQITVQNAPRNAKDTNIVSNFDNEGLPTTNKVLIDAGVLKFIPYSSFHASKYLQDKNLASGLYLSPFNFIPFPFPSSAVVHSGNKSVEQQISEIDDGLFVRSFWYIRFTIRNTGGLTGLTRNGLFHVKNGEIQGAVRNLRFTESFVRALGPGNVISLSKERRTQFLANTPNIHLKKFHFSSVAHSHN